MVRAAPRTRHGEIIKIAPSRKIHSGTIAQPRPAPNATSVKDSDSPVDFFPPVPDVEIADRLLKDRI